MTYQVANGLSKIVLDRLATHDDMELGGMGDDHKITWSMDMVCMM